MKPANMLFILSDQHNRDATGCYGHPVVQTPSIDRLANRGTRFTHAYTNCPICVPARASLATGRYVHQIGNWDNAFPYNGSVPGWHHRLREQGHHIDSIGKLHFRSPEDDNGFTREIDPLHVVEGIGDTLGSIRDNPPFRNKRKGIHGAGPGDSTYLQYDIRNADRACTWLSEHQTDTKPWILFLSFVCPHPPYIAPPDLYDLYDNIDLPLPPQWQEADWPNHPAIDYFRRFFTFNEPFTETQLHTLAAAYFGACTHLDQQIGRVLDALEQNELTENTRILYTSDHGESLGARGLFGKFTMYEEAAAVPFILAGPDVPQGHTVNTPISLVDCYPTVLDAVGVTIEEDHLPGQSLWPIAQAPDQNRTVFSEYHAVGSQHALYMVRNNQYKYIHYVNPPPQLFDLDADPNETNNLANSSDHRAILNTLKKELYELLDPEATDLRAKADQAALIETFGGEEAVRNRGAFDNSPVPGEKPTFRKHG